MQKWPVSKDNLNNIYDDDEKMMKWLYDAIRFF